MKRNYKYLKGTMVVLGIMGAFSVGVQSGKEDVLNNQIIRNDIYESGMYVSNYNGSDYTYWYESSLDDYAETHDDYVVVYNTKGELCYKGFTDGLRENNHKNLVYKVNERGSYTELTIE